MVHPIWESLPYIQEELVAVKALMKSELQLKIPDVREKILAYMDAPGKYLRAGLCLAMAQLTPEGITQSKRYIAAAIEVLHLATLIHDDVIDEADTRRGIEALHIQKSNRLAIYAGDYLMTYAARLIQKSQQEFDRNPLDAWVMEGILIGELNQLANQYHQGMTMYDYLRQIRGKTALLFAAATFFGYYSLSKSALQNRQAFYLGQAIGMAFQLRDDLIDYQVDVKVSGKPRMQDVQNGIYTAPLILGLQADPSLRQELKERGQPWSQQELDRLYQALVDLGTLTETERLVDNYLSKAEKRLRGLGGKQDSQALVNLLNQVMKGHF